MQEIVCKNCCSTWSIQNVGKVLRELEECPMCLREDIEDE